MNIKSFSVIWLKKYIVNVCRVWVSCDFMYEIIVVLCD